MKQYSAHLNVWLRCRLLLVAAVLLLLSGCELFGGLGDDNTPPPAPLVDLPTHLTVKQVWSTRVASDLDTDYLKLGPTLTANKIFTADATGQVTATQIATGNKIWQINTKLPITSGPQVGEGVVVVTTADAQVTALNSSNGAKLWRVRTSNQALAMPTIAQGKVIVKQIDGTVSALSTKDGQSLWSHEHPSPSLVLRGGSSPKVVRNEVIVGFADGKLAALDLETGRLLWEHTVAEPQGVSSVEQLVEIIADPITDDGTVFAATYQGKVSAVNVQSGRVLWEQNISTYTGLALNPRLLFVTDASGTVWAFDRATGRIVWHQTQLKNRVLSPPALMADTVVVGDGEGYLHWLPQDSGRLVGRYEVSKGDGIISMPATLNTSAYVLNRKGYLYAIKVSPGS